jgi:hypothetical protein
VLVFFVIYLMNHAKFYYVLPVIPLLISAGCVALEQWRLMRTRWLRSLLVVLIVGSGVLVLPLGLPVLPIDSFVTYARALGFDQSIQTEHNESKLIPGYFGQRIGWRAFAQTVAAAYHALPDSDRARCGILGFHYGESAAIDYFGPEFKLPNAIGRHNSYWLWGPGSATGEVLLVMLSGTARVEPYFRHVELVASYEFPYIDGPFRQHKIFLCRHAVKPLAQMWPQFKTFD